MSSVCCSKTVHTYDFFLVSCKTNKKTIMFTHVVSAHRPCWRVLLLLIRSNQVWTRASKQNFNIKSICILGLKHPLRYNSKRYEVPFWLMSCLSTWTNPCCCCLANGSGVHHLFVFCMASLHHLPCQPSSPSCVWRVLRQRARPRRCSGPHLRRPPSVLAAALQLPFGGLVLQMEIFTLRCTWLSFGDPRLSHESKRGDELMWACDMERLCGFIPKTLTRLRTYWTQWHKSYSTPVIYTTVHFCVFP